MNAAARVLRWHGAAAVQLRADEYEAVVVPELAMLVASLCWRGREHVARPAGLAAYRAGHTTAIPLLHPWANRLSARRYRAAGVTVDLHRLPLHTDDNGLPMHGTMTAQPGWNVSRMDAGARGARVEACFSFGEHAELLASFPFPHDLLVGVRLAPTGLHITTTVRPTGVRPVPISFGWHPYWRLASPRARWRVALPASDHLELDRRGIPTGRATPVDPAEIRLAGADLDDLFALGRDRSFALADGETTLRVAFDDGYTHAQVYSPAGRTFCAIEPMTAPTDALVSGRYPVAEPGAEHTASFRASIETRAA